MPLALLLLSFAAQVDARLLTERWSEQDHWADTRDKPLWIPRGELEDGGGGLQVFHWDSQGRIKFDRKELDPDVWIGYRALTIDIHSRQEVLDHVFADVALAVAAELPSFSTAWELSASAGIGTSNDGRFNRSESYFAVATVEAAQVARHGVSWHLGVAFDGNRTLYPDFPLPYANAEIEAAPELRLRVGLPESEIVWTPFDSVTIAGRWVFPTDATARVDVGLGAGLSIFAAGTHRTDGFHLREHDETRLFYELNLAELGLRFVTSWIDLSVSGGLAFEQQFFTGFDLRRRSDLATPEDRAFFALTVQGTF